MSGVVLIVYWSTLCPEPQGFDFSLIDKVLKFWREGGVGRRHHRLPLSFDSGRRQNRQRDAPMGLAENKDL